MANLCCYPRSSLDDGFGDEPASISPGDAAYKTKPNVDGAFKFIGGECLPWSGETTNVTSPIIDNSTGERTVLGKVAALSEADAVEAVEAAAKSWDKGQGPWPQLPLSERIAAIKKYVECLAPSRGSIVNALMWEICKNTADAAQEFDRTMKFIEATISHLEASDSTEPYQNWTTVSGVRGRVRRGPIGVTMMLAPFNYPLNEMYAMMIPALLMGNVIVLKLPAVGGLAHILTVNALKEALPAGVVNFVTGAGRKTMGPIMATGLVDCLGFIGGAKATDALVKQHPQPHRLKVFSQLEGKNIAVVLPDADLEVATKQILLGSLTYNGQRCTACKLIMVHNSIADALAEKLVAGVNALKKGLPWDDAAITPLPEPTKPEYLEVLIDDAVGKGAKLMNAAQGGGKRAGALFTPAVLYPVTPAMRVFTEEQFGPVVPIASFANVSEVDAAVRASWNGQQAAIFTRDTKAAAPLVDMLSTVVGRINLNAQCSRGPDVFPFSGRRSSAMGTMSVSEAIRAFSVEVIAAFPDNDVNRSLAEKMEEDANFFQPIVKRQKTEAKGGDVAISKGFKELTQQATAAVSQADFKCPKLEPASVAPQDEAYKTKPDVDGAFKFIGGECKPWTGEMIPVTSPIIDATTGERTVIGRVAALSEADAVEAVEAASKAWDKGQGGWPQLPLAERIAAIKKYVGCLLSSRGQIVNALMWEICKNAADAAQEFDRTMKFIDAVITQLEASDSADSFGKWTTVSGVRGRVRRGPIGVTMMLAPFNYPLNEMYAMMIPALLMGNVIVLKLPAVGGLAHILTVNALKEALPAGVVNFVTGAGRKTMGPIMATGLVDCLGFIGGAKATDALIKQHPHPHRLKVFSQLEGKNIAVVLPDADLEVATKQILLGSLSYNGQRCTACKLIMVHDSIADTLAEKLAAGVNALKKGLPWEDAAITPLPEPAKPSYLEDLLKDAVSKGANVINQCEGGGSLAGALFTPAVLYPVTPAMRIFTEEQFGPVVPIASFADVSQVDAAVRASWNGQQAAIFTKDPKATAPLMDMLSTVVGRVNLNSQCSRGPDVFPFSGRRSSAMGTMSVSEAIRAFSVDVIVAFPDNDDNRTLAEGMAEETKFFQSIVKQSASDEVEDTLMGA